ncbi:uncharacterized protein K460DRAFT_397022 [Cucurbitaria berberidis CBS 394.84]|uniref:Uncharacterized protein n=1 Tax=Cucurbitaria berberidis CBS 394.84 TaxID=1168544 RepID=A0A9P4L6Y9_9PLEO|nr:uncharacterized protein K460DRAFT_397022 [Cucurbitaria berberidis CBS 394.84]KAF1843802.1 hypothetical protein K460DRAFT_397022 [Cucurbitaria berberidis CBS 394.84]
MSSDPDHSLTHYHQPSKRRFDEGKSECPTSPSTEPEASLPEPSLFSSLLFNRERVYRDSSSSVLPATSERQSKAQVVEALGDSRKDARQRFSLVHAQWEREGRSGQNSMLGILARLKSNQMAPVSKGRGKPAKKIATKTKAKAKVEEDKSRKRPAPRVSVQRISKSQKTESKAREEANTKKKVDGLGGDASTRPSVGEPMEIVDSDDDIPPKTSSRSQHDEHALPGPLASKTLAFTAESNDWSFQKLDSLSSKSDWQPGPSREETGHTIQRLRQELEAANSKTESVERLLQQRIDEMKSSQVYSDDLAAKRFACLQGELKEEREAHRIVIKERDQLLSDVDISRTQYTDMAAKYADLECRYDRVSKDQDAILEENCRLVKENQTLTAVAGTSTTHRSTLSPAPSSSACSNEEKKTENIRRTYVKVKRRFDHLHKAANDLATCTWSIDVSNFGEFGQYLKQLRTALDEDSSLEGQSFVVRDQSRDKD